MKILPLINSSIFAQRDYKNNQYDYSQYRAPVLTADTVSFSGKEIYCSPGRNAILKLAEFGVGCFCCGKQMIPISEINFLEKSGFFKEGSDTILNGLKKYENFMPRIERRVYNLLNKLHKKYPDKSLRKLLESEAANINAKLIAKQSKVFGKIYKYSIKHLPDEKVNELSNIFQSSYEEMLGKHSDKTFSRSKFIGLMYKFTRGLPKKHETTLLKIADTLPSSKDTYEAFIVKYSRKNNREIALRLINKRQATIEHVKAKADGGSDDITNLVPECAECNWGRGNKPIYAQVRDNPNMPQNSQKQANRISTLINANLTPLTPKYLIGIKKTFYRESGSIIDLDISKLKEQ